MVHFCQAGRVRIVDDRKGELIQKFLQTADSRVPVEKFILSTPENPGHLFDSSFVPVQTREGPGILVVLSPISA